MTYRPKMHQLNYVLSIPYRSPKVFIQSIVFAIAPTHDASHGVIRRNSLRFCSFALSVNAAIIIVGMATLKPISNRIIFFIVVAITYETNNFILLKVCHKNARLREV